MYGKLNAISVKGKIVPHFMGYQNSRTETTKVILGQRGKKYYPI
jgi:hypothetical protein